MTKILHIDASCRHDGSVSRELSKELLDKIKPEGSEITYRDISGGMKFVDDLSIATYFIPKEERTAEQQASVDLSDELTQEVVDADILVIGIPIYNFCMPAVFKAWCDMVARVGITFRYTEHGPVGLLENKKAYVAMTSGGTPIGSDIDFLTPWLRHFLGFIGIKDVEIIGAQGMRKDYAEESIAKARTLIAEMKPA